VVTLGLVITSRLCATISPTETDCIDVMMEPPYDLPLNGCAH
jgi:hypothetical protein